MTDIDTQGAVETVAEPEVVPAATENAEQDSPQVEESTPELTVEQQLEAEKKARAALEKRVARQTAANREQQRRYEEALREREAATAKKSEAPKQDDYETIEEYLIARGKHEAKEELKAEAEREREAENQKTIQEHHKKWAESFKAQESAVRQSYPDYDDAAEVLNEAIEITPPGDGLSAFLQCIKEAENGPSLIYHLGKNPELIEGLRELTPVGIIKAMARIELELESKGARPKPEITPKPITPTRGTGRASKSLDELSGKELLAHFKIK